MHVSSWPGEPRPGDRGGEERRDATVAPQIATQKAAVDLDVDLVGERDRQPLAARAHEQPERDEGQRGERRPAQQADVAVDPQAQQARRRGARCAPMPLAPVAPGSDSSAAGNGPP